MEKARNDSSIWAVTRPADLHRDFDLPRYGYCWDMAKVGRERRDEIRQGVVEREDVNDDVDVVVDDDVVMRC